jgi:2-haloacid dehalogenase
MTQIKAILWDYGNVLVEWSPRAYYEKIIANNDDLEFFLEQVCPMSWHHLHDSGFPMKQTIPMRQKEFPKFSREIQMWHDNFADMILGEITGSIEIVKTLNAKNFPQYVLTNMPSEVVDICFNPFDLRKYFTDIIVSGDEKIAKPDKAAFELTLKRMGNLMPNQVFFTDDNDANINAALELGIIAHKFINAQDLELRMRQLGILI